MANNIIATLLVPTRKRTDNLKTFLGSIESSFSNHQNIEVFFRLDEDDIETLNFLSSYKSHKIITNILIGERFNGWMSLDIFLNEIAVKSKGKYLIAFNDDCIITEKNFNLTLEKEIIRLERENEYGTFLGLIPFHNFVENKKMISYSVYLVPKTFTNHIGLFTRTVFYDGYFKLMCEYIKSYKLNFDTSEPISHIQDTASETSIDRNNMRNYRQFDERKSDMISDFLKLKSIINK